ncbi:MAG: branched-chain amino acid ABC transporter permease [Betaproteobacteria bacterium]|nr:branched-chain amino acid ABC transporter permease [Betaproteobacteria bacterium]
MEFSPSVIGQMLFTGALMGSIYGAVAMGFSLIFGVAKIINFAHAGVVLWVMYGVLVAVRSGVAHPYVAGLVAIPLCYVIGHGVQRTLMARVSAMSDDMQIIYTFGLLLVLTYMAQFFFGPDVHFLPSSGLAVEFGGVVLQVETIIAGALALGSALALHAFLSRTWLGKAIRASADNRRGATLMGLDVVRLSRVAMALSFALAALAGTILVTVTTFYPLRGLELAVLAFVIVVLGGMDNVFASFVAGVLIGMFEALGTLLFSPSIAHMAIYAMIFAVLLVRPQGLFRRRATK